jgi:hypothetical protein
MPKRYAPKDIEPIFKELQGESDRAIITVGGSLVEYALEQCIRSRLRLPKEKTEDDVLFTDAGIIGSFYEKTWVSFFLKIIGPETRNNIDLVRKIRNEAAHNMNPVSFSGTPEIMSRCASLAISNEMGAMPAAPKDRFILATQFYSANLLLRSGDDSAEVAAAFESLAPYLDR